MEPWLADELGLDTSLLIPGIIEMPWGDQREVLASTGFPTVNGRHQATASGWSCSRCGSFASARMDLAEGGSGAHYFARCADRVGVAGKESFLFGFAGVQSWVAMDEPGPLLDCRRVVSRLTISRLHWINDSEIVDPTGLPEHPGFDDLVPWSAGDVEM